MFEEFKYTYLIEDSRIIMNLHRENTSAITIVNDLEYDLPPEMMFEEYYLFLSKLDLTRSQDLEDSNHYNCREQV